MSEKDYYYKGNPEYIETKNKRVQLLVQPTTFKELKRIATEKEVSLNELVNCIFKDYIKKYNEEHFDLEKEMQKLKVKEFVSDNNNWEIIWNNKINKPQKILSKSAERVGAVYFEEESLTKFIANTSSVPFSRELFFEIYTKLFIDKVELKKYVNGLTEIQKMNLFGDANYIIK